MFIKRKPQLLDDNDGKPVDGSLNHCHQHSGIKGLGHIAFGPLDLWQDIKKLGHPDTKILISDLLRPATPGQAEEIVEQNAANEAKILKEDFYNSLLAAYSLDEIHSQLTLADLKQIDLKQISDRHWQVAGTL